MPRLSTSICQCVCLLLTAACHKSDPTIARVNGEAVTQSQWDAYLKFKHIRADIPAQKNSALDDYVTRAGLAATIESDKLLDTTQVQTELAEFKKELLISRYFEKFLDDKVTEQAIQNYYTTHATDYEEQKVHVAHILVRLNPKLSEAERKARLTIAQDAYSRIKTGKDFAAVASEVSEDNVSAKAGGDLGWLRAGSVDPGFSKRAFELPVGEVSEPFETPFGFHLIKVLEAAQTIKKPLRSVQGDIRYQLRADAKATEMARLLGKVKLEVDGKPRKPLDENKADQRRADRR